MDRSRRERIGSECVCAPVKMQNVQGELCAEIVEVGHANVPACARLKERNPVEVGTKRECEGMPTCSLKS